MGYASYGASPESAKPANPSKTLAKTFGYMAIGLAISALTAFIVAYLFATWIGNINAASSDEEMSRILTIYLVVMIASFIGMIIDSAILRMVLVKGKKSIWVPYIIYALLMGVFLSSFLVIGLSFELIGTAFVVSALVFLGCFLVGYFSKNDLSPAAFVGMALLFTIGLTGIFFLLLFILFPALLTLYFIIFELAFSLLILIVVAIDCHNIKRILGVAENNKNIALYCAFTIYSDFIVLFVRVLRLLVAFFGNRK